MVHQRHTRIFQPVITWTAVIIGILTMVLAGCGGKHLDPRLTKTYEGAPEWVTHGSDFYEGKEGVAFYGVGSSVLTHIRFRREQAEQGAIANVGRPVQSKAGKPTGA